MKILAKEEKGMKGEEVGMKGWRKGGNKLGKREGGWREFLSL
jgi:hypothetical protein